MAIFERTHQTKAIIDDTEKLICTVESAQNVNKHTEYLLRVQRGPCKDNKWTVSHRYSDFASLHASLQHSNIELPLPPKKLIGNMQPSFIAERQVALQNYINEVLKHQILALSLPVRTFLDPSNYSLNIAEQALQTMSIALRGDGHYELKGPLPSIGWRVQKHYFSVTDTDTKTNYMLSWQNYGVDRYLNDKDLQAAFKSLQSLSHPYIDPIMKIHNLESGVYVVRRVHENGSLRDILYDTDYTKSYLSKYGNPKIRKPFTEGQIAHYGYQILEAIKFLHEKGLPHGHIHPGNIAIHNQRVQLMGIENNLMGVASIYRPYILEAKRINTLEVIDMYCFGRTLYEMALGVELDALYCDYYPDSISSDLESILRICISYSSCKHGIQTVNSLLLHPFFTRATLNGIIPKDDIRAHLKFPLTLKDELKNACTAVEMRLKTEQKLLRSARKEVRIQEILSSEEEVKKLKRRAKKRDSLYKSTSSLAETVRSQSVSTASSPTPPATSIEVSANNSFATLERRPSEVRSPTDSRSALLDAICGFDKNRLARVASR